MRLVAVFFVCMLIMVPAVASANMLVDSGFEGSGAGSWIEDLWGGPWVNDFDNTVNSRSGESLYQSVNGSNDPGNWEKAEAKQIISINPGDVIGGGAWLKYNNLNQVEAKIECKWLDAAYNEISGGIGTSVTTGTGDWEYQDLNVWSVSDRTAPEGASYVDFRLFLLAPGTADTATGEIWWDDADFGVIPEPASIVLLIGGITGLLIFRKRRR
ncbi:PEP-CTERM sorting domain-containing protein [bacterium]|jgi:hypothetical protein|nr:PEP-CTERM sorting domain-containing protein [bacterium]